MPSRYNASHESDSRTSEEIVTAYRRCLDVDDSEITLAVVHYRGGLTEFALGKRYAQSLDPLDRAAGASVLAQLGWSDQCFREESVGVLLELLKDCDDRVIEAAAYGLGHRNLERCIPFVLPLVNHPNADIRLAVVSALSRHDHPDAIRALIVLSQDENRDVRNWAAFGLGSQTDLDTPELRDALTDLLGENDDEIRGEALIGLAKRHDGRVLVPLMRELEGPFWGSWCLEAAEFLAEPRLHPLLLSLRESTPKEDVVTFARDFESAIQACAP